VAGWFLKHGRPDLDWKNCQGKAALMIARTAERGDARAARAHGRRPEEIVTGGF